MRRGGSCQNIFHQRQTASLLSSTTSSGTDKVWRGSCSLNIDNLSPRTYQQMGELWGSQSRSKSWMKSPWSQPSHRRTAVPRAYVAPLCSQLGSVWILPQTLRCEGGFWLVCLLLLGCPEPAACQASIRVTGQNRAATAARPDLWTQLRRMGSPSNRPGTCVRTRQVTCDWRREHLSVYVFWRSWSIGL